MARLGGGVEKVGAVLEHAQDLRGDDAAAARGGHAEDGEPAEGGKAALFEDLVVAPEHRKRGIAASLLKHVIAHARADGVLRLTLLTDMQNERAQALYRRLGFVGSPMKPMRLKLKKGLP